MPTLTKNNKLNIFYRDEDSPGQKSIGDNSIQGPTIGLNPFLDTPSNAAAIEYKKGYVMRKCCFDSNYKKSEFCLLHIDMIKTTTTIFKSFNKVNIEKKKR